MLRPGPLLALLALGLLLPLLHDQRLPAQGPEQLLERLGLRAPHWRPSLGPFRQLSAAPAAAPPDPAQRPLALLQGDLLTRLSQADRDWIPRSEPLPGGGTRYLYKRRPGDPQLTIPQIQALIARPPSFRAEQQRIRSLLQVLDQVGAAVELSDPLKIGAAGEWDPQVRTLRLKPDLPERGSVEFARVLNHEAIHVAQSCAAGGLRASPRPLGLQPLPALPSAAGESGQAPLQDPLYANLSPRERQMEHEAYALQHRLELGERLVRLHCLTGNSG
ncbi:MAG: hypothetical protein ACKOXO_10255 [Cyanobium sp.]